MPPLSPAERERYARHLALPEIGEEGQLRLRAGAVLVIGAGGLGSPALLYLAAAGVGRIGVVDFDTVDVSNLQRQVLYGVADVGRSKALVAAERLRALNPDLEIVPYDVRFSADNALGLVGDHDVVVDGSDRFATRYLVADACELAGRPCVYGAIQGFEGQVSVFDAARGPTYRDLFPDPPPPGLAPRCADAGVLGVLPGVVGTLQATEALKLIAGVGEPLIGRLLLFDALRASFRTLRLARDPARAPATDLAAHAPPPWTRLSQDDVAARRLGGWRPAVLDVRTAEEAAIDRLDGTTLRIDHAAVRAAALPDGDVLIYCAGGARSTAAARALIAEGMDPARLFELDGGLRAARAR